MGYSDLKTGDIEPSLGKKINTIVYGNENCIVYIDDGENIQWVGNDDVENDEQFGSIINKMSYWESICNKVFRDGNGFDNKCLLAEGIGRVYINKDTPNKYAIANEILDAAINKIEVEGENILRNAYVKASLFSFVSLVALLLIEETIKNSIISNLGHDWHSICQTAMLGGVGAFVSAITRAKDFKPELIVDKEIHILDGILRVVLGILTAVLVWLGIKSNLIFSFLNNTNKSHYIILFMGMVSGISERILPTIVKQFEAKVESENKKTDKTDKKVEDKHSTKV